MKDNVFDSVTPFKSFPLSIRGTYCIASIPSFGVICAILFFLVGCDEQEVDNSAVMRSNHTGAMHRVVATSYWVSQPDGGGVACYDGPSSQVSANVTLANGATVGLVSVQSGMVYLDATYWLYVYPEKHPNIQCYIAAHFLDPLPVY